MDKRQQCPICTASLESVERCEEHFHQMLYWEMADPAVWEAHHLMVLGYHLQHPHLYSPEGLDHAKGLLLQFVEEGQSTEHVRQANRETVASGNRTWTVTAREDAKGAYAHPVTWTMTAADVVNGGAENYIESVKAWAASILASLKAADEIKG